MRRPEPHEPRPFSGLKPEFYVRTDDPYVRLIEHSILVMFCEQQMANDVELQAASKQLDLGDPEVTAKIHAQLRERLHAIVVDLKSGKGAVEFPKWFKGGDIMVEYIRKTEDQLLRVYLDSAWTMLTEEERQELSARFNTRILKAINGSGALEVRTKEVVLQHVARIADEVVAARAEEIRAQVTREVDRRWEEMVEAVVSRRLAEAIAKIKLEMGIGK